MSIRVRLLAALSIAFFSSVATADNIKGAWSAPFDWPLIAAHAVLTPDGRVLTYGTDGNGKQTGYFIYDIWDPSVGASAGGHLTLPNGTGTDIFCSSQIILPQSGNIFLAGGDNWTGSATTNTGNNNTNVFSPYDNTLARGNNLNRARWYSTSTTLINGEIYIQGGSGGADLPEIRDLNGNLRLLSNVNTSAFSANFPRNWLAPDGRIFGFDTAGRMYYVWPASTGLLTAAGQLPGATSWTSSAVMFQPGRILQVGGASSAALVIDINGVQPVVTATQSMSSQRQWVSATVLPDGRVLGTGGSAVENQLTGVNNVAELWNPATGTWTQGAAGAKARLYHSFGLLLPDATVLVGGGGAPGPLVNLNAEIYYPPYLFDADGQRAPRPVIESAPDTVVAGDRFQVGVSGAASISRVSFIKTGSTTHSVNMDQRYLSLPFTANGALLDVQLPSRAGEVPPGYYLLFVLDGQGVPSVSRMVRVGISASPPATPDFTPTPGGAGGAPFTLACEADEVLVGVHGTTSTYVYQVGPLCARINQSGQWIGAPEARSLTGRTVGPTSYSKACPVNSAISGFRGRFSQYVNQLDFECRALTADGKLTGNGVFLGAVGPATGTAQGPWRCDSGNPAYALYGRSGGWMDSFGLQCRQGAATFVNTPPTLGNPGSQSTPVGATVQLLASASDADGDALTFSAMGLPAGLSLNTATGTISGSPATLGDHAVALTVSDGTVTASVNFTWSVVARPPFVLATLPPSAPQTVGTPVTYTASATNGVGVLYSWFFDDDSPASAPSSSPSVTHTFTRPGIYYVTVTASSEGSPAQSQTLTQVVHEPLTANRPAMSSNIVFDGDAGRVWVVNQDNDSVSVFAASSNARLAEIPVGSGPRTLAIAPNGNVWVANKHAATISVINPVSLSVTQTLALPYASQPFGIAFAPTGGYAFVALEAGGSLLKLDAATGVLLASTPIGRHARHVSVSADGSAVYVSRFVTPPLPGEQGAQVQPGAAGGAVLVLDASSMTLTRVVTLGYSDLPDFEIQGSGIPNYLGAVTLSPDGLTGWVPSKQDNIARGTLRSGANLNFQNTVRAIASRIDLGTGSEDLGSRVDLDNASLASAAVYDLYGNYLFVALETSREIAVVDAQGRYEIFRFNAGRAPQGLALSRDGRRLYVNNFMDRTVGVFDVSRLLELGESNVPALATLNAVSGEALGAQVLKGKQLFYDARDTRLARDAYMSCASCHNDGGSDGRTWDLTGMGEGLRNTVSLRGRAGAQGQGFLHWSANFDEVQDFEGQIRSLAGGSGLMSDSDFAARSQTLGQPKAGLSADLDALAAYVQSLSTFANSPLRNANGSMTASAVAGREVFRTANCARCHGGASFTISASANLEDVGTLKPTSGSRLGGPLGGIDVPTLRDVWATAPYLHDGSAATLADAITAHAGVSLGGGDLANLVAYVEQIGAQEASAPTPNRAPVLGNPGNQSGYTGVAVALQLAATDADGDALAYSAGGLPTGLSIASTTGRISGTPTKAGSFTVTVTASDGRASASQVFIWTLTVRDTTAPSRPSLSATVSNGRPSLSWSASSDNVGVAGYIIYRSTNGTQGSEVARVSLGTRTWVDIQFQEKVRYTYSVKAFDAAGNLSPLSTLRSVTPSQVPSTPKLTIGLSNGDPRLTWAASTDNVGVAGYIVYRATSSSGGSEVARTKSLEWIDTSARSGRRYYYNVRAYDAAGNLSSRSSILSVVAK
ncbi:MAG TPA: putative Ig domain-containing protein [Steroidobacteraceae bacterium]